MLNHVTGRCNVCLHHCDVTNMLRMIATKDIRVGEELVNNYGELTNAGLLLSYGFVEDEGRNPHDAVEVPLVDIVAAVEAVRISAC
jgi:hypothetical protein